GVVAIRLFQDMAPSQGLEKVSSLKKLGSHHQSMETTTRTMQAPTVVVRTSHPTPTTTTPCLTHLEATSRVCRAMVSLMMRRRRRKRSVEMSGGPISGRVPLPRRLGWVTAGY
ncbi:hypothetical protein LTR16_012420, partial [Cryomyces antarcticus]